MYGYIEFKKELVAKVQRMLGDRVDVSVVTSTKNNGVAKEALSLKVEGETTPQIHMWELYERYCDGELIEHIAKGIEKVFEGRDLFNEDVDWRKWETAKKYLTIVVLNTKWNENLWSYTVHKDFLDLSFICKCVFYRDEKIQASYDVLHEYLDEWGISEEQLWTVALENFAKEEILVEDIGTVLSKCSKQKHVISNELYVVSNNGLGYGAKVLLDTKYFEQLANKFGRDVYILPSSIHEVICLPAYENRKVNELRVMIRDVNSMVVPENEWLSDEVYLYSRETKEISIAQGE